MILSQPELEEAIKQGDIRFDPPLREKQIRSASVDLRLGYKFTELRKIPRIAMRHGFAKLADDALWAEKNLQRKNGERENYVIEPGEFILAQTLEHIYMPNHLIAMIEGVDAAHATQCAA